MAVLTLTPLERFLAESGEGDRRELLLGQVFEIPLEHRLHSIRRLLLFEAFREVFGRRVVPEASVAIPDDGAPNADLVVTRETATEYTEAGPWRAEDVVLVVEVCVSTADRDYSIKDEQYSKGRIPEYWILDPIRERLEVRTEPGPLGYHRREVYGPDDEVRGIPLGPLLRKG